MSPTASGLGRALWLALLLPAALLGGAYIGQYGFDLYPCEMCWWQRYPHFAALAFALLALLLWRSGAARPLVIMAALSVVVSGLIGGFHAGVEYGWWDGLTACTSPVKASGGNFLDALNDAPIIRCDSAPWDLFGISLAGWNFLLSVGGGLAILRLATAKAAI